MGFWQNDFLRESAHLLSEATHRQTNITIKKVEIFSPIEARLLTILFRFQENEFDRAEEVVTMTTHTVTNSSAQMVTVGDDATSVIAVENSSPEVIHVVSLANNSAASLPSQIYTLPGTQMLSTTPQVLSGLQTLTFNTANTALANVSFPIGSLQQMVSNLRTV